jgi:hypothetical protein
VPLARQRSGLDLFERRYEIFSVFREGVGQIVRSSPGFDQQKEREFLQAKERAYFFFGDDVQRYLEDLWNDIVQVRTADAELPGITDPETRKKSIEARRASFNRVEQFYSRGLPLFGRYMRFSEPIPIDLMQKIRAMTRGDD